MLFFLQKYTLNVIYGGIGAILAILSIVLLTYDEKLLLCSFLVPGTFFFTIYDNAIVGYLFLVVLFLCFKKQSYNIILISVLVLLLLFVGAVISSNNSLFTKMIKTVSICIIYSSVQYNEKIIQKHIEYYVLGSITGSVLGVLYYLLNGRSLIVSTSTYYRFCGLSRDPNFYAAFLCISFALLLVLIKYKPEKRLLYYFGLVGCFVLGVISLSRGFLITIVISSLLFLFLSDLQSKAKILILVISSIILFAIAFPSELSMISDLILSRVNEEGGSGRLDIWQNDLHYSFSSIKNILFGSGSLTVLRDNGINVGTEHNSFLQMYMEIGIIGCVAFILLIRSSFVYIKKKWQKDISIKNILPLLSVIIVYFFLSAFGGEFFIVPLYLGYYSLFLYPSKLYK